MDFNFSNLANASFSNENSTQYLKPFDIYTVKLTKIEKGELKGSKDPNAVYPIVTLEFTGTGDSHGIFTKNLFIPTSEKDSERPEYENANGHKYQRPSRMENFQYTLMQLVHVLNPAGEAKIIENASKIKSTDRFIDLIVKALTDKDDVETKLKLVGRNANGTTYAELPNACGLNKEGNIFPINFIGDNLFFSNYEIEQQKKYQNATPTDMGTVTEEEPSDEINLDDIDL